MADDENGDSEMFDISTLTEAERRRLRRRQRILDNQGARLNRILYSDPNAPKEGSTKSETERIVTKSPSSDSVGSDSNLTGGVDSADGAHMDEENVRERRKVPEKKVPKDKPSTHSHQKQTSVSSGGNSGESSPTASLLQELSGSGTGMESNTREQATKEPIHMGVQSDGTVILPRISGFYGRLLICLLALFLSVFNAKRYLITFASWEVAYYFINGLPPLPPPDMMMVLAAVVGLQENQLLRIKKIIHFSNCVLMDFSLFLVFTLMPHFVRDVISV